MFREGPATVKLTKLDSKATLKFDKPCLEVENTGNNLESIKADVKVKGGKWFYEAKLVTYGKIQIGWCTDKCTVQSNPTNGIGNDAESWSYDGSCQKSFGPSASSTGRYGEYWNQGDIIGTVLDLDSKTISYYRNGKDLGIAFNNVVVGDGIYPAASSSKKQKCAFNFGKETFKFPLNEVFPDIHPLQLAISETQQAELDKIFDKYRAIYHKESEETDDLIKGDGLAKYSQDLGIVDDKDPSLLVIAWKLNTVHGKCWELTREEFLGWAIHSCWNLDTMKKKAASWRDEIKNAAKFRQFYNFVFDYLKEDKKVIGVEEAATLWEILGIDTRWPLYVKWHDYIKAKKSVSRDAWRLFLNFVEQYPKDVSAYDADGCWPSVIDEFVDHVRAKDGKKES